MSPFPMVQSIKNQIINGDALEVLKTLPSDYVHCIITSPPYWGLRDYGKEDQLGLESNPNDYVDKLTAIFSEAKRVLRPDGTLWLNIGDSYAGNMSRASQGGRAGFGTKREGVFKRIPETLKAKDLVGIPWRVAFAHQSDGWYLRQDIIWHKPNAMPESVKDRCTKSHEHVFLLTKSPKYYFDKDAIAEKTVTYDDSIRNRDETKLNNTPGREKMQGLKKNNYMTKNKRDVWTIAAGHYKGAHFAAFPQNLIIPCIQAGTSEQGCCSLCGMPMSRELEITEEYKKLKGQGWKGKDKFKETGMRGVGSMPKVSETYRTVGWKKNCECDADVSPCIVMDIFMGSGTTAFVSKRLGRRYLGIELNEEYVEIANNRLTQEELFI